MSTHPQATATSAKDTKNQESAEAQLDEFTPVSRPAEPSADKKKATDLSTEILSEQSLKTLNSFLDEILEEVKNGQASRLVTPRDILMYAGKVRRGAIAVRLIDAAIEAKGLHTTPYWVKEHLDTNISFKAGKAPGQTPLELIGGNNTFHYETDFTLSQLRESADKPLQFDADQPLGAALSAMVLEGKDCACISRVTGLEPVRVVTWKTVAQGLGVHKIEDLTIGDVAVNAVTLDRNTSAFRAITMIGAEGFAVLQDADGSIWGPISTTHIANQLCLLAEPSLLISDLEKNLRATLHTVHSPSELTSLFQEVRSKKDVRLLADNLEEATLPELASLYQYSTKTEKISWYSRDEVLQRLQQAADLKRRVAHIQEGGLDQAELALLRNLSQMTVAILEAAQAQRK